MDFKVIWSDSAIADLEEICGYISRPNPAAAGRVGESILPHVDLLAAFPYIGPRYPTGSEGDVRAVVCGNYRVFYQVNSQAKQVAILRVWHGRRGEPPEL
jgi:plasmid stabilization system protein ParE